MRKWLPGPIRHWSAFGFALLVAVTLTACGGTKVYDSTKTIVYAGAIYNVTDTRTFSSKVEADLPDGSTIDITGADRDRIDAMLDEHDEFGVAMSFMFDDQEMLYRSDLIDSYRDYSRLQSDMERAGDRIAKLLRAEGTEQLNLR